MTDYNTVLELSNAKLEGNLKKVSSDFCRDYFSLIMSSILDLDD